MSARGPIRPRRALPPGAGSAPGRRCEGRWPGRAPPAGDSAAGRGVGGSPPSPPPTPTPALHPRHLGAARRRRAPWGWRGAGCRVLEGDGRGGGGEAGRAAWRADPDRRPAPPALTPPGSRRAPAPRRPGPQDRGLARRAPGGDTPPAPDPCGAPAPARAAARPPAVGVSPAEGGCPGWGGVGWVSPCARVPSRQPPPRFPPPPRFWREPRSQQGGSAGEGGPRSCPAPCPLTRPLRTPRPCGGGGQAAAGPLLEGARAAAVSVPPYPPPPQPLRPGAGRGVPRPVPARLGAAQSAQAAASPLSANWRGTGAAGARAAAGGPARPIPAGVGDRRRNPPGGRRCTGRTYVCVGAWWVQGVGGLCGGCHSPRDTPSPPILLRGKCPFTASPCARQAQLA